MEIQETSIKAYESIQDAPHRMALIHKFIRNKGGATCDEVEYELNMLHQSASALINKLRKLNIIRDSGQRKLTRTNRKAIIWEVNYNELEE